MVKLNLRYLIAGAILIVTFNNYYIFSISQTKKDENAINLVREGSSLSLTRRSRDPVPSYDLAREESFGFFTDITDDNWRIAQKIAAKTFPNFFMPPGTNTAEHMNKYANGPKDKGKVPALKNSAHWNGYNFQEEFHCPYAQRIPSDSEADGPKWICDPHRLAEKVKRGEGCIVYSVGSNGNIMFEKAVKEEISPDCEIHTFDVINSRRIKGVGVNFTEALLPYAQFHHWGIGTEQEAMKSTSMKTLNQTIHALGHAGKTIDIFKIDCEWCEWFTFREWLSSDSALGQILVETHNAPMPNARDFFFELHDAGYVIFSKEANFINGGGGVEFAFLKLKPSFFVNETMYSKQNL